MLAEKLLEKLKLENILEFILWNNQQMQLYAVNFIPLLGSLYMFRVFYTPIIRSTIYNCIYIELLTPGANRLQLQEENIC